MTKAPQDLQARPTTTPVSHPSFSALKVALAGRALPEGPVASAATAGKKENARKIVVRRERAGRGGKQVTIVEGLTRLERENWTSDLAKALGTGARSEGDQLVVQGELAQCVVFWLQARGLKNIVLAN